MDFKGFYDEIIFDVDKSILKSYTGKQGDTKSRGLYVTVTQKNAAIEDLTGLSMRLFYEKPDKTRGFIDGVVDGNKFRIDYTNQMYAVPGVVKAELRLMGSNEEIITAKTFKILVDSSIADGSIISENERGILDRAFELAEDIIPRLELLDVELLEDVQDETLGARHSNTKDETYDSLGQRLDAAEQDLLDHKAEYTSNRQQDQLKAAKVEKELNDYKATMQQVNINQEPKQKVSGYGVISLPPNAANGQVSASAFGNTRTNLINNNVDAWEQGTIEFATGDNASKISRIRLKNFIPIKSIQCALSWENNDFDVALLYYANDNSYIGNTNWITTRTLITPPSNTNKFRATLRYKSEEDITPNNVTSAKILLEVGDEYKQFINGTKSTISAMRLKSVGKNLFDGKLEYGDVTTLGNIVYDETRTRTIPKNPPKVQPNTTYTIWEVNGKLQGRIFVRDKDNNVLEAITGTIVNGKTTFTTPNNSNIDNLIWRTANSTPQNTIIQLERGTVATPYEPYTESSAYVIVTDQNTGEILEARSLPNGAQDEINVTDRKLIKRIGEKSNIANGMEIDFADMAEGGTYYAWNEDGETETGIKGDTLGIDATTLIYQMAEPIEIPVQVSGSIVSYPNGTIYIERILPDAGVYTDKISILHQDAPIKRLDRLSKVDFYTGVETELDVSEAVIAEDKLSFTHPDLSEGDIVFFEYEYDVESTQGEAEVEYYDSRYTIKDSVTNKFYKWNVTVADGVPSIELVEV